MLTRITHTVFLLRLTINEHECTCVRHIIIMAPPPKRLDIVCNESNCNTKFNKIELLRNHLRSVHNHYHEPEEIIDSERTRIIKECSSTM